MDKSKPQVEQVTIFLTPIEATAFMDFQKYRDLFLILQEHGAFQIQFGKCTLNFAHGVLQNVIKEEVVYKR